MSALPVFTAARSLLVAMPQLDDPNFYRSVVLMIEHDARGALGLIINQGTEHPCAAITREFGLAWPGHPGDTIRRGGPVEPQSLWMLHDDGWCFDETTQAGDGVAVSRSREALSRMCQAGEQRLRLFVGYAGWGPGQLEAELADGSWLTAPGAAELVFDVPIAQLWHAVLARLGIDPAHLVGAGSTLQ